MIFGQESETLEFKRSTSELDESLKDYSAILNKHGAGEVYYGISHDGTVKGQDVADKTLRDISWKVANHIEPKIYPVIERIAIGNKQCIKVSFEGSEQPYKANGKYCIRVFDESLEMSSAELRRYFKHMEEAASPWDSAESDITVDEIDERLLMDYVKMANAEKRILWEYGGVEDALGRLELLVRGKPVNAAKVMFGTRSGLELQMATFATDERLTFIDISNATGTIKELVDAGETYVKKIMLWRAEFGDGMERHEVPEVPVEAIREALWNSYAHRIAESGQNNEIASYKDRIEIYNPGTFPDDVEPEDYIHNRAKPIQRNPLLAQVMYYPRYIEHFGTGLKRINDACVEAGVEYDFRREKLGFTVVFYRPKDLALDPVTGKPKTKFPEKFSVRFPEEFSEGERRLLELIAADGSQTSESMAQLLSTSRRTITKRISRLKAAGAITRIGSDKKGYWQVVNPDARDSE
ncbi:MAG: putative DNA binding domain-containing protein [Coriobacteriales bacterium]|nr:putative DNA binding domain-containing protein [Coriobacteriales bacterium]